MKRLFGLAMMLLMVLGLVACETGGPSDTTGTSCIADPSQEKCQNFTFDKSVEVVFWNIAGKQNLASFDYLIKGFNEIYPNITVTPVSKGDWDDLFDMTNKALTAGTEPNLVFSYTDHVANYQRGKHVVDLTTYVNSTLEINGKRVGYTTEEVADFVPAYYNEGFYKGKLLSLPFSKSTEVMFYNKTFFDANGLTVPKTWTELEEVSARIRTILGEDSDVVPFGYDSEANLFITMAEQNEYDFTTEDGEILFNNSNNKSVVTWLKGMYDNKYLTTKSMLNGDYTSTKFTEQKLYMSVGSTGGASYNIPAADGVTGALEFEVGVAMVPQANLDHIKMIQQGPNISMFKGTEDQQLAAWLFLKYLLDPVNNANYALNSAGYSPVRISSYQTPQYIEAITDYDNTVCTKDSVMAEMRKLTASFQSDYFYVSPAFEASATVRTNVGTILTQVFAGTKTVDDAFKDAYDSSVN